MRSLSKNAVLIFLFIASSLSFAQKEVILKRIITVDCDNPAQSFKQCDYGILVPANRPGKQEVLNYSYSIKPDHVLKTEDEEYFIKWKQRSFSDLNDKKLEVSMKVKITPYDLSTAKKKPVKNNNDLDTLRYLKQEENFRSESKMISKIAEGLNGNNREEIVKNIFDYVINALEYHIFTEQNRGAKQALKDGKGDCTEYSELMVTLCRAKKIPARIVKGLIPRSNGEVGHHNWVEVFFPEYGWVAFDPTWADHKNSSTTFYSMLNMYIQISNKRFITSVNCSCSTVDFNFSLYLNDSCRNLSKGINANFFAMQKYYDSGEHEKAMPLLDSLLAYEKENYAFWMFKGMILARMAQFEKGYDCLKNAMNFSRSIENKRSSLYAFSNYYALKNDKENSFKYLKEALDLGFSNYAHIMKDKDLINLKDYPPFMDLQNELQRKLDHK